MNYFCYWLIFVDLELLLWWFVLCYYYLCCGKNCLRIFVEGVGVMSDMRIRLSVLLRKIYSMGIVWYCWILFLNLWFRIFFVNCCVDMDWRMGLGFNFVFVVIVICWFVGSNKSFFCCFWNFFLELILICI